MKTIKAKDIKIGDYFTDDKGLKEGYYFESFEDAIQKGQFVEKITCMAWVNSNNERWKNKTQYNINLSRPNNELNKLNGKDIDLLKLIS